MGDAIAERWATLLEHLPLYGSSILCALVAGAALGLLGVYVVSRRIVFVSAALGQVSALGVVLGFLIGLAGGATTGEAAEEHAGASGDPAVSPPNGEVDAARGEAGERNEDADPENGGGDLEARLDRLETEVDQRAAEAEERAPAASAHEETATAPTSAAGPWPPLLAIGLSLGVVLLLVGIRERTDIGRDAVLGVAFVVPSALVLVLAPLVPQKLSAVEALLHGSAVLVRPSDLVAVLVAAGLVFATQLAAFRGFVFATLDPLVARSQGLPVVALDVALFGSIALMTGVATRAIGALPTFGLTVLPAVGALGLRPGLRSVFLTALATGAVAGGGGYVVAHLLDGSVGATQTLVALVLALALRAVGATRARTRGEPRLRSGRPCAPPHDGSGSASAPAPSHAEAERPASEGEAWPTK